MNLSLILHPLDYSAGAKPALARALALAKWHDADLHVLHVRSRRRGIDGEEAAHARLREFVEARNPEAAKFETVILAGDPVAAVADYARPQIAGPPGGRQAWPPGQQAVASGSLRQGVGASGSLPRRSPCRITMTVRIRLQMQCFARSSVPRTSRLRRLRRLKQALVLAQQSGGRLTVLHVLDGFPYETVYSGSRAFRLIDEYRGLVAQVSRQLRNAIPQDALNWCDVQTRVVSGVPHRAILSTAARDQAGSDRHGTAHARSALDTIVHGLDNQPCASTGAVPGPYGACPSEHDRESDTHDVESSTRARLGPLLDGAGPCVTGEPDRRSRVMVTAVRDTAPTTRTIRDVLLRVQGEYRDMPGLKLTEAQAQRLLGIDCDTCAVVLSTLIERRFLRRTANGLYVRAWD